MYEFIKGILIEKNPNFVVLDVIGIGYRLHIAYGVYSKICPIGESVRLFTSFIVKEDSQTLYGFLTKGEKQLFNTLITISGVGPKLALTIIGYLDQASFQNAIQTNNPLILAKIPGIGKKTAERLILEMKDKLKNLLNFNYKENSLSADCINALINLGYNSLKAQTAVQKVLEEEDSQEIGSIITKALKILN
jgi:holliday junction DNA helicase RuvA